MADERKYRQQGYKDTGGEKREARPPARAPGAGSPPAPAMPGKRTVSRCAECGSLLTVLTEPLGDCPKCRLALHACKQCAHFDPGRRFECAEPVPERIADKRARNECERFSLRVTVERETSTGPLRPEDARRGFDSLFRR